MKKTLLITSFCALAGLGNAQMTGKWQWKNPSLTTTNLFNVTYVGNNTYFAAGAAGTIVKSTNGGATWQIMPLSDINKSNYLVEHSCFVNSNLAFVSNGGASTFKTTNGGTTWTDLSSAFNGGTHLSFVDEQTGWKSYLGEVAKTTNGGTSWSTVSLPNETSDDRTVYMRMFSAQSGWLFRSVGKLYKTTDGNAWTSVNLPSASNGQELVYFKDASTGVYARPNFNDTLYFTTNGGTSWSSSIIPFYDKGDRTAFAYAGNNILVALYNTNVQPSQVKIARSTNGGGSWTYIDFPAYAGRITFISMKDDMNGIAMNGFGGILSTTDGGATWTRLNACGGMTGEDLDFRGNNGLLAGHYGVTYTRDGGSTFHQAVVNNTTPGTGTDEFNAVTWIDDSKALAMGYGGYAYFSADTGATWNQGNYTWFVGTFYDVAYLSSANKIIAVGRSADGAKNYTVSTNGGNSWTAAQMPGSFDVQRIYFYDNNLGFATGADSSFYASHGLNQAALWKTTNGGTTWTKITLPDLGSGYSSAKDIFMIDANKGWLVGNKIWKTTDGGNTWTTVPPGVLLGSMTGVYFEDAMNGHIIGMQGYYIYTTDGGNTWTAGNLHTYGTLKHFGKIGNTLAIVTDGGGLITQDGSSTTGVRENSSENAGWVLYPNPAQGRVNINLQALGSEAKTITLMDITGRVLEVQQTNATEAALDLGMAAKGIYFVKLSTEGKTETRRLVVK